jgi:CMP-N-acetylneuraminic acid synthetase
MNASIYIYRRSFFDKVHKTAISDKSLIFEMKHTCFDIDEPIDFLFMEYLLKENLLDIKL